MNRIVAVGGIVLAAVLVAGLASGQTANQVIQSVETRWADVYCDLLEVSRPNPGELMVRFRYRNAGKQPFRFPGLSNLLRQAAALEPAGGKLYGPLKDATGQEVASSTINDGTMSGKAIAAGASQAHYVKLEAPPDAVTAITVMAPGTIPFENVTIGAKPAAAPMTAPLKPLASADGETEGLVLEVTDVRRTTGGSLTVLFRYRNTGTSRFSFPGLSNQVSRSYVVDSGAKRKYEVIQLENRSSLCSTTLEVAGTGGQRLDAGDLLNAWARFPAPPAETKTISFTVPGFVPVEKLEIAGTGAGSAAAGSALAGAVVGLEATLKDLGARVTDKEVRIEMAADVLFDFDKADIKREAEPALDKVATVVKAYPGARVAIEGHTDGKGNDDYNMALSERRADAVARWLIRRGAMDGSNVSTKGWGKTRPAAPNTKPDGSDDPDGRAKNRRVEIVVAKA
jgi:outer membrane protein OmpA-like peptidoglycan-associated protein